jgi:hypothetical protein
MDILNQNKKNTTPQPQPPSNGRLREELIRERDILNANILWADALIKKGQEVGLYQLMINRSIVINQQLPFQLSSKVCDDYRHTNPNATQFSCQFNQTPMPEYNSKESQDYLQSQISFWFPQLNEINRRLNNCGNAPRC